MHQSAHCHIFAAGSYYGLRSAPTQDDYIIAADGGYQHCQAEGLTPHLLIGDFDSLELQTLPSDVELRKYPPEKDDSDSMLAIKTGLALGYRCFHLHGCSGGRLDHTIANLQGLAYLAQHHARGFLYTETETFTAITNDSIHLSPTEAKRFSIFCLGEDAIGVTIQGAKYLLEQGTLTAKNPMAVSNCSIGLPISIQVEQGTLLICWTEHSED